MNYSLRFIFAVSLWCIAAQAEFNRSLFYRTSSFWNEPRLVQPYLASIDFQLLGGSNHVGRNCQDVRTTLTSIYGPEDIQALSQASPGIPLRLPGNPEFIGFKAIADVAEFDLNWYQNYRCGFFTHFHFPLVRVRICPSGYVENPECLHRSSKRYCPSWENPLSRLTPFLSQFDIKTNDQDKVAPSDSTLFVGWSNSYTDTCYLDFVDTAIKTGVLFPTGREANVDELFSIPYGYNGHWGIPLSLDCSIGIYEWFTWGYHFDGVFFFNKERCLRMRTQAEADTGIIVLGKGLANVHQGPILRIGSYYKADHVCNGLSLLLGFSYENKRPDEVCPLDLDTFKPIKVNEDMRFASWSRSMIHFLLEYDFANEQTCRGTRIGLFYDLQLTGKRVFDISTGGGYLGFDAILCF